MKEHKEVRWTEVVRRSLWDYVYKIQRMEQREAEREAIEKEKESKQQNII